MPCANPVARSCVRSAANAVDAIVGLSRPPGSLIYSDFMGGLGGADPLLGYSLLGGQYQDGVLVGLQPACDDLAFAGIPGVRGMRTEGQITNLFSGDPSIARSVTLTAQVYTLQVFGSGSVTCSYGTATAASPLTFTAIAGATLFTPSGVSQWMLSATPYPVPYVPPGTTQTSTAHNGTSGVHYAMPQNGAIWNQLNGKPDGVELWDNVTPYLANELGGTTNWAKISSGVWAHVSGAANAIICGGGVPVGSIGKYSLEIRNYVSGSVYVRAGTTSGVTRSGNGSWIEYLIANTNTVTYVMPSTDFVGTVVLSAKKLIPQPLTLAARIVPGVGSAEIPNSTTLNIRTCRSDPSRLLRVVKDSSGNCRVELHDGTNTAQSPIITWSRYQQLIVVGQVLNGGLQMRAGAKVGAGALSFGSAVTYAGSFGPDAVYSKLMLAHSNVYPVHTLKDWLADYQSSEADILAAMGVA